MVYAEDLEKSKQASFSVSSLSEDAEKVLKNQLQSKIVTNVFTDDEFKHQFLLVFKTMAEILSRTLGPYGSSTMIDEIKNFSVTKDGFHVLSNLRFADERQNRIRSILFSISHQMVTKVGDGSTSAVVAAYQFLNSMMTFMQDHKHVRPKELNERIQTIVKDICDIIANEAVNVNKDNYLDVVYNIANIATNENKVYTDMITDIYRTIGMNANVNLALSETFEDKIEYEDGVYSNNAYLIDPIYINRGTECYKKDCCVLMFDHTLDKDAWNMLITAYNRLCYSEGKVMIVIAPYYDQFLLDIIRKDAESLKNTYADRSEVPFNIIFLKSNLSSQLNKDMYRDLSTLLGATIYRPQDTKEWADTFDKEYQKVIQKKKAECDEKGISFTKEMVPQFPEELNAVLDSHAGYCEECVMTNKNSSFKGFTHKNEAMFNTMLNDAKNKLDEAEKRVLETDSVDNKVFDARTRYTKITCRSATIKVGGANSLDMKINYDAVDDAVKACASAIKYGYNQGCNLAIIKAISIYNKKYREEKEMDTVTYTILDGLRKAFLNVYRTVLTNGLTNEEAEEIIEKSSKDFICYDLVKHDYDTEGKVVNSCRTDIEILKGAIAMTGVMLICNQYIASTLNH